MIDDVIIIGAGPAGAVAATLLVRAGVRVRLLDRATFPRDKLCGDTVNPGALAALERLGLADGIEDQGLRISGMRVTGPHGVTIDGRYPSGTYGRAILRRDLDWALVSQAIDAGVRFEPATRVKRPLVSASPAGTSVDGVTVINDQRHERELRAPVTIAADGRRSTLAFALGLARHPPQPRRWAIGAYYDNASGLSSFGEMHIRSDRYIGVAPIPGGLANVCLVKSFSANSAADARFAPHAQALCQAGAWLSAELARDPLLRDRFATARLVAPPTILGPLAVEPTGVRLPGLLLAGDAAGFVDPMTGDGLCFAIRGGALAADAALEALTRGWSSVHGHHARAQRREFAAKWQFNRALRRLVASPRAIDAATVAARLAPGVLRRLVAIAGDCGHSESSTIRVKVRA